MDSFETQSVRVPRDEFGGYLQLTNALTGLGIDPLRMADLAIELETRFGIRTDQDLFEVDRSAISQNTCLGRRQAKGSDTGVF